MTDERLSTRRLNEMGLGFMPAAVLVAGIDLRLFDALAGAALKLDEIALRTNLKPAIVEKLVTACAACELVVREEHRVSNAPDVERFLVRGKPTYFGDYLSHLSHDSYGTWGHLSERLAASDPSEPERYYAAADDPAEARALTEAGYTGSQGTARRLVRRFDFSGYRHLFDLGGGSGVYSIHACEANPELKATVFDFPNVLSVAAEFIAKAGLQDRINKQALDFTAEPLPAGADVILLCGNIHAYSPEMAGKVVRNCFAALPRGGAMIICDYMLNDERTGPPFPAFISLRQGFMAGGGHVHSGSEFRSYLEEAGFVVDKIETFLEGSLGWATARKP